MSGNILDRVLVHLSSMASASSFLRWAFSSSIDLSCSSSGTSMPPNFLQRMQKMASEIACLPQSSGSKSGFAVLKKLMIFRRKTLLHAVAIILLMKTSLASHCVNQLRVTTCRKRYIELNLVCCQWRQISWAAHSGQIGRNKPNTRLKVIIVELG